MSIKVGHSCYFRLEGGKDNNNSNSEQSYTSHEVHSIDSNIPSDTISDQDTLEDFISYSGSDNRCDEVQNFLGDNLACQNPIQAFYFCTSKLIYYYLDQLNYIKSWK